MERTTRLLIAADAASRVAAASRWLAELPPDAEVLVVGASWEAADDLVRNVAAARGALFGTTRATLDRLAARLAAPALARARRTPASALSLAAVVARAVHALHAEGALPYFAPVVSRPGFATAVARTLDELRMNDVEPDAVRALARGGVDLAALAMRVEHELTRAGLADRSAVYAAAIAEAATARAPVGLPVLLADPTITSGREAALVAALARRAPTTLATVPAGDERTAGRLEQALACRREPVTDDRGPSSLQKVQSHLFEETTPERAPLDDTVTLSSWPGEARECVEIARAIQAAVATERIPFDRIAVFLRSPAEYRAHLEEAFRRAAIPAFFARGMMRPDPAGRALLALLACAAEHLSARRFAEYLSLAQVPDPDAARDAEGTWVGPSHDLVPTDVATPPPADDIPPLGDPDATGVAGGSLRTPWRWERLLVDAAVIGGTDRWERRLTGLENDLRLKRGEVADEDDTRAAYLERKLHDLRHLRRFALPLIGRLAALPKRATWGDWLDHLRELAEASLQSPTAVLETLIELAPMSPVGPVDLDEVQMVLAPRLRELTVPPSRRRYGAVFVAPTEAARGLSFDLVFVPGLAERLFPRKIVEDPILLDAQRRELGLSALATQATRVADERLALRLAVGAAAKRVVLSYPRLDVEQARPRVPSFYGLETLRAAEGALPGFQDLGRRAEAQASARLGWPAPARAADAIDEAEYDLALLAPLLDADPATTTGTASYLLGANPHLARALRVRARRWLKRWTPADGLVDPDDLARAALGAHQLAARAFSPTGLQHYATCPYRFFLQAIHRLAPREEPVALEVIDPLTRGGLFHEVQFQILTRLRDEHLLPITAATLPLALERIDAALVQVASRWKEELVPAIPRVWQDGIESIRADLREWLRRGVDDEWVPDRFELSFGLNDRDRPHEDPASVAHDVAIGGGLRVRGSIDLVERRADGVLRATDHKTGKVRARTDVVIGGGEVLQPLLYALVAEELLHATVESGRLYYCTADGGYQERVVPLDAEARYNATTVAEVVGGALAEGFLPAAPVAGACRWCDYRLVCGPYEEIRVRKKPSDKLAPLTRLRSMP